MMDMMQDEDMGNRMVLFMTGVFVGAAVALLLAPQSGRESRDQLWGYGRRLRDRIGTATDEMSSHSGEMLNQAGQAFNQAVEKGREYVQGEMPRTR